MTLQAMPYAEWQRAALQGKAPIDDILLYKDCGLSDLKMLEESQRRIRVRISSAIPDRDNDTIRVDGWETGHYEKNPVVLYAHNYWSLPIGKAVQLHMDAYGLSAVDEFASAEIYPFADTVYQLIKNGYLNTASVGFRVLEYTINEERHGVDFIKQELLEHSIVPVPANPDALVEARSLLGAEAMQPLIAWCEETLDTWRKAEHDEKTRAPIAAAHQLLTPASTPVVIQIEPIDNAKALVLDSKENDTPSQAPESESDEPNDDILATWIEAEYQRAQDDSEAFFTACESFLRDGVPVAIREAVQREMIALTGRLPD